MDSRIWTRQSAPFGAASTMRFGQLTHHGLGYWGTSTGAVRSECLAVEIGSLG